MSVNTYLPTRYDEMVTRLALGVEPIDALRGGRVSGPLRVTFDECPRPLHEWRRFPAGVGLDDVLPRMLRHASGRYIRRYQRRMPDRIRLRISDSRRRYVPRRFVLTIATEADVSAGEAGLAPAIPIAARIAMIHLHPGANADIAAGVTAIRGQVRRADGSPAAWIRVRANRTGTGDQFGFTHGDERGEFLLVLSPPPDTVGVTPDPVSVELTVGVVPPPVPPPTDPLVPQLDPLWQLFEEPLPLPAPQFPATGTASDGRRFPPEYVTTAFAGPFVVSAGQVRSVVLTLP